MIDVRMLLNKLFQNSKTESNPKIPFSPDIFWSLKLNLFKGGPKVLLALRHFSFQFYL